MTFPDYFSDHADRYEALRPTYPDALFAYLASLVPAHDLAWDCATGNGQAALGLTPHFDAVVATDASPQQIALAPPHPKVSYLVAPAERTPLKDGSVDLVTVALALHWFDLDRFYAEVRRVVRPGGVIACWTYHLQTVSPDVDAVVRRLYADILGPYWSPEVRHIENGYRSLPFPFEEITPPPFCLVQKWEMHRMVAFMGTWSGSQRYRKETGKDPLDAIRDELTAAWGDSYNVRMVAWGLHLRVGRVAQR
jgi:ubiquinone/menaquinone biosynthesis C-methylase UbiE